MYGPLVIAVYEEALRREPGRILPHFPTLWQEPWVREWLQSLDTQPALTFERRDTPLPLHPIQGGDGPAPCSPLHYGGVVVPLGQTLDKALEAWAHLAILAAFAREPWVAQASSWHRLAWCKSVVGVGSN